jgi:hypothetical protein
MDAFLCNRPEVKMVIPIPLRSLQAIGAIACCVVAPAQAVEQRIECPAQIAREAVRLSAAPAGWQGFVPFEERAGVPLVDANLMYGPPSTMFEGKPEYGSGNVAKWTGLIADADGLWMACWYGEAGRKDFVLSKRLDDNTTECSITHGKTSKDRVTLDIRCTLGDSRTATAPEGQKEKTKAALKSTAASPVPGRSIRRARPPAS